MLSLEKTRRHLLDGGYAGSKNLNMMLSSNGARCVSYPLLSEHIQWLAMAPEPILMLLLSTKILKMQYFLNISLRYQFWNSSIMTILAVITEQCLFLMQMLVFDFVP